MLAAAPVRVEISRTVSSFVSGHTYNVTCQVQIGDDYSIFHFKNIAQVLGSNPPPDTSLWLGGSQLEVVRRSESEDGKIFSLVASFTARPDLDGGFLSCRAVNKYVPEESLEDQWRISVLFPPAASLRVTTPGAGAGAGRGVTVREGARVVLQCSAHSNPPPFNYHWRQDGHNRNHSQLTFRFQNSLHTYLVYGKSGMTSRF